MNKPENPLAVDEDFFIEVKQTPSGSLTSVQEDVDYFLKNLYAALKIPKEYLNSGSQGT